MNFLRDRCHPTTHGASWTSFPIKKNWDYFQESPFLVIGVYVTTSIGMVGGESTLSVTTSSCITHIKSVVLFSHMKLAPVSQPHRMWSNNLLHWPGGAFLACVLLYKIDMEVSHMRWGPGYYIHGGPCMHVDQDTACTVVHACMLIMPDSYSYIYILSNVCNIIQIRTFEIAREIYDTSPQHHI